MRYLVPVVAVMAVVATGETGGWKKYQAADSQVEIFDMQQARGGTMPTRGFRVAQLSQ